MNGKKLDKNEQLPQPKVIKTHHERFVNDGTNYDLLVFEIKGAFGDVGIGHVTDGILVVTNRSSYMFRKHSYLAVDYIKEKLSNRYMSNTDATNVRQALLNMGLIK